MPTLCADPYTRYLFLFPALDNLDIAISNPQKKILGIKEIFLKMALKANQLVDSRAGLQFTSQIAQIHTVHPVLLRSETGPHWYHQIFNFTFFGAISQQGH